MQYGNLWSTNIWRHPIWEPLLQTLYLPYDMRYTESVKMGRFLSSPNHPLFQSLADPVVVWCVEAWTTASPQPRSLLAACLPTHSFKTFYMYLHGVATPSQAFLLYLNPQSTKTLVVFYHTLVICAAYCVATGGNRTKSLFPAKLKSNPI